MISFCYYLGPERTFTHISTKDLFIHGEGGGYESVSKGFNFYR